MKVMNQTNTIPGPQDIFRKVLENGITLLVRSNFNSSSVFISGYAGAGSQLDPMEKLGLAHFTSLGLTRGTAHADFQTIYDRLESVGASLGFGASVHNTNFSGRSLVEDLPLLLNTLADCLVSPVFPGDQVDRLKAQLLTGLAIRAQSTGDMAALKFDSLLFPGHPYGRPEDGFIETVTRIEQGDLVRFHCENYGPQNLVIVIVGAIEGQRALELVEKTLGRWHEKPLAVIPPMPEILLPKQTITNHVEIAGKSQSDLVIGTLGPKRSAPEYLAASLGNSILGQFGLMGRIGDSVREKAGLAYYASTSLNAWINSGSWEVNAGVNPGNVQKATDLIIRELKRFTTEHVTEEELTENKSNYIGRLPLSLESNAGVANAILNLERFDLGLDYLQRYSALIQEITIEDILATARKYIDPERLFIVSAGTSTGKAG